MFSSNSDSPVVTPRLGRSVSIDQAAELLNVSRRTIYNRIREGKLQTIRAIAGSQRVLVASLRNVRFRRYRRYPLSSARSAVAFDVRSARS